MKLRIDGKEIRAREGQSVLDAALDAGIYIPHLCSHPLLEAQGGCKMCSVEIEGRDGISLSCLTPAEAGMEVRTDTAPVRHIRQLALELMLAGHPSDCTSCTVYLNCELQNLMQYLGVAHSRLRRIEKRNIKYASGPANPLMRREMERCVQCGRCVRACKDLRGVGALDYRSRDGENYVGVKEDRALSESDCRFCGACVEVCPTGAIQDKPGVFPPEAPREQALVPCKYNCPAHVEIYEYIRLSREGKYGEAAAVIREKLTFPQVLGLVCNKKCEEKCKRSYLDEALSIRDIKRYAIENDRTQLWRTRVTKSPATGRKAAIIGSGPAGLSAAWHLARKGHEVTVFEKDDKPGGVMRYGIPVYRLPREVLDEEIDIIREMGVEIYTGVNIVSVRAIREAYDAVVVAAGALQSIVPYKAGEEPDNVYGALDLCRRAATEMLPDLGETLTVVGGGSVAFDCARIAARSGVKTVRVLCLESRDEMLADEEEIEAALKEGVELYNNTLITDTVIDENCVEKIATIRINSFSFGPGGLEYEAADGSEAEFTTNTLVYAIGQRVDLPESFGLDMGRSGTVAIDEQNRTSIEGVFAAGDVTTGTKSLVEAIASGTKASAQADLYLGGDGNVELVLYERDKRIDNIGVIDGFAKILKCGFIEDDSSGMTEASRCLQCDLRLSIPKVKYWGDEAYRVKASKVTGADTRI